MRVYHNIPALFAYNSVNATNNNIQKSINKLSTGLRINSAADDAAGLAISEKMRAQIRGLDQAVSNSQDGISMIQTAEGALNETHSILQRMRELSVQSANDTLTNQDRRYIQDEIDQLTEEIDRISTTTQFNKKKLLDGSASALWSSDKLETKAFIRGGLRSVDQFGQKSAVEGNYTIRISAKPGEAEIKKSDLFTVKHENVIMNVGLNTETGARDVKVDSLPAGDYNMTIGARSAGFVGSRTQSYNVGTINAGTGYVNNAAGASIMFEVLSVNTAAGTVVVRAESYVMSSGGTVVNHVQENLTLTTAAKHNFTGLGFSMGALVPGTGVGAGALNISNISNFKVGGRHVMHLAGSAVTGTNGKVNVSATINSDWANAGNWPTGTANAVQERGFAVNLAAIKDKDVHFRTFYLNTQNGNVFQSDIRMGFNKNTTGYGAYGNQAQLASFTAAYVGQIAEGDVSLRDLDKFWDANGRFLLDDPQDITITQGDGKRASITLNSTDTLDGVAKKLNDAIAFGLGQSKYVGANADKFVSFVGKADVTSSTPESVRGTMVIRSAVSGKAGQLAFAGDEDIIKGLSLNVIQKSSENEFRVTVQDAHNGNTVASGVKVTGNNLRGVVHKNVDVEFNSMANIDVAWSNSAKSFLLTRSNNVYETTLHLADNSTVFQIGANEKEDMGINMGDMGARSLGVDAIIVTDRESAARSITVIDNAIDKVSTQRSALGAYQNRLDHTINNLTVASQNLTAAESRIRDLDMAKEMMNFTKLNILMQAGNSMLAQANQLPQNVLSLLR